MPVLFVLTHESVSQTPVSTRFCFSPVFRGAVHANAALQLHRLVQLNLTIASYIFLDLLILSLFNLCFNTQHVVLHL